MGYSPLDESRQGAAFEVPLEHIVRSSDGRDWNGVDIAEIVHPQDDFALPAIARHVLVINLGAQECCWYLPPFSATLETEKFQCFLYTKEDTMLSTYLTTSWQMRYPIIGAPMANIGRGRLARAVSQAGGLGMIGVGSKEQVETIRREAALARGDDQTPFGIGLMTWAIEARPELLEAALEAHPFLISISFGSPAPYVETLHQQGIRLATQVNTREEALHAAQIGVDLIVAQGTEAGGHTGQVGTLPLLQLVLDAVQVPVVAAGGIATPRGVAAALAAGADGVWVGTCLLGSPECESTEQARSRIVQTQETETILTSAFDIAQQLAWPSRYPGRALRNRFTEQWAARAGELVRDAGARQQLAEAIREKNYELAFIYAGEAVGMVNQQRPAAEVIRSLGDGAEQLLRKRSSVLLGEQ